MFKSNVDLILLGVKNNASTLLWINEALLLDKSFVLKCADLNGRILKFLNEEFKNDLEIIIRCLENRRDMFELIPTEFQSNTHILDIINS
jgi:hypothetical protein